MVVIRGGSLEKVPTCPNEHTGDRRWVPRRVGDISGPRNPQCYRIGLVGPGVGISESWKRMLGRCEHGSYPNINAGTGTRAHAHVPMQTHGYTECTSVCTQPVCTHMYTRAHTSTRIHTLTER